MALEELPGVGSPSGVDKHECDEVCTVDALVVGVGVTGVELDWG